MQISALLISLIAIGILFVIIMVGISRWIFRINAIIDRLDNIIDAIKGEKDGKQN